MEIFSVFSSVVLDKFFFIFRIILDEVVLYLFDKCNIVIINLNRDYVCVMDVGFLELIIIVVKFDFDGE